MSDRIGVAHGEVSRSARRLARDPIQDAVDEPARLLGPELLGDLDRLVDGDLGGHLGVPEQLVDGRAQDVAVHGRHALEIPVLRGLGDEGVDLALVLLGPRRPAPRRRRASRHRQDAATRTRPRGEPARRPPHVELVEELEGDLARFPTPTHASLLPRPQAPDELGHLQGRPRRFLAAIATLPPARAQACSSV